jgi:hypothetical protein
MEGGEGCRSGGQWWWWMESHGRWVLEWLCGMLAHWCFVLCGCDGQLGPTKAVRSPLSEES